MIRLVRIVFSTLALVFTATILQAQFLLEGISGIVSPNRSEVGLPDFTAGGTGNWGFGDPNRIPRATGELKLAQHTADLLNCTAAPANYFAGKIAVVKRGTCQFGDKALKAQNAGAVGIIIVNHSPGVVNPPPGDFGGTVTIPVVMVTPDYYNNIIVPALANGPVTMRMGSPFGVYANNLLFTARFVIQPPIGHRPSFLVNDVGDLSFAPGASVFNFGSATATNVKIKAVVRRLSPNPAEIYADSITSSSLDVGDTLQDDAQGEPALMENFDLVTSTPGLTDRRGLYELSYETSSDVADDFPSDNRYSQLFRVSDTTYSAVQLNETAGSPNFSLPANLSFSGPADANNWSWGQPLNVQSISPAPSGFIWSAKRMIFYVQPGIDVVDSLAGLSVSLDLLKWQDIDSNGRAANDETELTLVGQGVFDFTGNNQANRPLSVELLDAVSQSPGALLEPNSRYIFRIAKDDNVASMSFGNDGSSADHDAWLFSSNSDFPRSGATIISTNWPSFLWIGGTVDHNRFGGTPIPSLRLDFGLTAVANKEIIKPVMMMVYPNPASDKIQVSVADKAGLGQALIQISDAQGRVVRTESRSLQGQRSYYHLSVSDLERGFYNVSVRTNSGSSTSRLVLTR